MIRLIPNKRVFESYGDREEDIITISKKEWSFVAIAGLVLTGLSFLPMVVGYLMTPPGNNFLFRSISNAFDNSVYYSYIEQAKAGNILFKNLFTPEAQGLGIFNPFFHPHVFCFPRCSYRIHSPVFDSGLLPGISLF